jgi:PAS domain-containing protein
MSAGAPTPPEDAGESAESLIELLIQTEQRLEDLTAGEVDTVTGRDGRAFVLRRAQDELRHSEADRQATILNALPAHIAMIDGQGRVTSVNEAWRQFADANELHSPGHAIGADYLAICDRARGAGSAEALQVAEGIRSVLRDQTRSYSIEYPCDSPTQKRWF